MESKIYLCPADKKYKCKWKGSSDDVFDHFSRMHEDLLHFNESIDISLDAATENHLLLLNAEIYLLQLKVTNEFLNIYLRFLGPARIASTLTYDVHIGRDNVFIAKEIIEITDGAFRVPLESLYEKFKDISNDSNSICCKLMLNEKPIIECFDNIFTDNKASNNWSNANESKKDIQCLRNSNIDKLKINLDNTLDLSKDVNDLSPNLQDLFDSSYEENLTFELCDKKTTLDESDCVFDSETEYKSKNIRSVLTRSLTFTPEDMKRNIVKRQASMRSLTSIAENDLDDELKCSNCNGHLAAPIFYCIDEHNICVTCYQSKQVCTLCEKEITSNRNLELEKKSVNFIYTCVNRKSGCPKKLSYADILDHEINCTFCVYFCPMEECSFKGSFKYMVGHLSLIHSSVKLFQSFIAVFQKYQEIFLVNETMGIFYCSWTLLDNSVIWKAKFCGPKARKFFCELKFKGKNFKEPLLLIKQNDVYIKEMSLAELKEYKIKPKHSILTVTG
ncbi:uncharacterized protein LOC126743003 isoform X2 [Anthonomus grandis grandis]|nr:uncharacterized protein LOC126743003 isoform X2 [Anthonomus grandis grandis]XP_050305868.1 uncharacterized protein LOC126743003 isoform X2 [Anthonomus grandis grandis]XP_050305869.1 uncharacterized protein LOC126743003 isoform X2 [Anthonomus grandis grandis]XP_050305870.1 uncharacterized protein LOC126743003 isoform X2 [Anthonomus grandis grandis]XP_050305872.1 uncharacterized protein LOC126743003 isoform X2 [Anthonomus grandis grandis]XP_050305873.1 uncharacterized protein LOC126743003 iso